MPLPDAEIERLWNTAVCDDYLRNIVPSDIRALIAHIREQAQTIADLERELANQAVETDIQITDLKATIETLKAMLGEAREKLNVLSDYALMRWTHEFGRATLQRLATEARAWLDKYRKVNP